MDDDGGPGKDWRPALALVGHGGGVTSVASRGDGRHLLSNGKVWCLYVCMYVCMYVYAMVTPPDCVAVVFDSKELTH